MSSQEMREWVVKAETDYKAALALARRRKDPLPEVVCFHCQQCAEKYLKAFLIARGMPFPISALKQ
jgi:HEPN domain-containing protein